MRTDDLFKFIKERHSIWEKRQMGLPKPWTDDPILQSYRFCNVCRELDTQTKWFAENWRRLNPADPDLWFASLVFRFVNWYDTCIEIGYPVPWNRSKFISALNRRKAAGEKVYSSAYMISTHGVRQEKSEYLADSLGLIWKSRGIVRWREGELLQDFHKRLMRQYDVGSFMAAQVIADIKYTPRMNHITDWWTFAASGPGSKRGLNRIFHQPVGQPWKEENWKLHLDVLYREITPYFHYYGLPPLHAQDLQNCLCEFDKYERVRLGEGRPRQKYDGAA